MTIQEIIKDVDSVYIDNLYEDHLNECYSELNESLQNLIASLDVATLIKEHDKTMYNCGLSDFLDACDYVEIDGDYYEKSDVENAINEVIEELENENEDLEESQEDDELEDEIKFNEKEIAELNQLLVDYT